MLQIHEKRSKLFISEWLHQKEGGRERGREGDRKRKRSQEGKEKKQIKYPTLDGWLNTLYTSTQ